MLLHLFLGFLLVFKLLPSLGVLVVLSISLFLSFLVIHC